MGAGVQGSGPGPGPSQPLQQPLSESQGLQEVGRQVWHPAVGETGLCTEVIPSRALGLTLSLALPVSVLLGQGSDRVGFREPGQPLLNRAYW